MRSARKTLLENFFSLAFLQIINMVLPLITLPYIVRALGVEKFGLVNFATSFVTYFSILTDYSFNLSTVRDIVAVKTDKTRTNQVISTIFCLKTILLTINFLFMIFIISFIDIFKNNIQLYIILFGIVIGGSLSPIYVFQAFEKMRFVTIITSIIKTISTCLVFFIIKNEDDYIYWAALNSITFIVTSLLCIFFAFKVLKIKFVLPLKSDLIYQLQSGWSIFISTIAISMYTVSNTFILGLFTNNVIVGYYTGADKIIKAAQAVLYTPISQAIYPRISSIASKSKDDAIIFINKILKLLTLPMLIISITVMIFSKNAVMLILGSEYLSSVPALRILALTVFLVYLSNILGVQTMLNFGKQKAFSLIYISAAVLSIFLSLLLVPHFKHLGTSIVVLSTEMFVTILMYLYVNKNGMKISFKK